MNRPTNEAFWWGLFSAGGVLAAIFVPVLMVITGFVLPNRFDPDKGRLLQYDALASVLDFWLFKIVLLGIIMLIAVHCAHRMRHIVMDIMGRPWDMLLRFVCYGGALVLTLVTAVVMFL
jgi:fumarate reductase subunit D